MDEFRKFLSSASVVLFDGAMGTELVRRGLEPSPMWNTDRPEVVAEIHRAYRQAGADVILTNTFAANRIQLERKGCGAKLELINARAVEIARDAGSGLVAGDIGPTGEFLEPYGTFSASRAEEAFAEQARCLERVGVDLFIVETMSDPRELAIAVKATGSISKKPVVASMCFDPVRKGYRTTMGTDVGEATEEMAASGAEALGLNCGSVQLSDVEMIIGEMRGLTELPLVAQPNAGKPVLEGGKVVYKLDADSFAAGMTRIHRSGAKLLGGCCGTTPAHIAALCRFLKK